MAAPHVPPLLPPNFTIPADGTSALYQVAHLRSIVARGEDERVRQERRAVQLLLGYADAVVQQGRAAATSREHDLETLEWRTLSLHLAPLANAAEHLWRRYERAKGFTPEARAAWATHEDIHHEEATWPTIRQSVYHGLGLEEGHLARHPEVQAVAQALDASHTLLTERIRPSLSRQAVDPKDQKHNPYAWGSASMTESELLSWSTSVIEHIALPSRTASILQKALLKAAPQIPNAEIATWAQGLMLALASCTLEHESESRRLVLRHARGLPPMPMGV